VKQVQGQGGVWHWWEGGGGRKRDKRMNKVLIMNTYVCKCKSDTSSGIRGGGMEESKYDISDTL
jgi:hypothetical protein